MGNVIVQFGDFESNKHELVGGKGANLGSLARAGFRVPPGFTITTESYSSFLLNSELNSRISQILSEINFDEHELVEEYASRIRALFTDGELPKGIAAEVSAAYDALGNNIYVAVRSSGTAEDLAGASFAGLHDTYLDIHGNDAVLEAVKRCWASLWTARAMSYRNTKGFDHLRCPIAVVVQTMIESEISGVMFTGNPINTATDEIVINSSWGLGEAIVAGITTPDNYVVNSETLKILERTMGSKRIQIVRNPGTNLGTVSQDVPESKQGKFALSEDQILILANLGICIQANYGDVPQDIEWAFSRGEFYVLQSRPITAVDFSWDADINASVYGEADDDQIWSRNYADDVWTGAITPLMFSCRAQLAHRAHDQAVHLWGFGELESASLRPFIYHKGEAYHNTKLDRMIAELTVPPPLRKYHYRFGQVPKAWREEVLKAPFSWKRYFRMYARIQALEPNYGWSWVRHLHVHFTKNPQKIAEHSGVSSDELLRMSDRALKKYILKMIETELKFYHCPWTGLFLQFMDLLALTEKIVTDWYDGDNRNAYTDLITGSQQPTATQIENQSVWQLADRIRASPILLLTFRKYENAEFFGALERCGAEGKTFLEEYAKHIKEHGHRGHSDRDIYFTRRIEDPSVDYRAFQMLLSGDPVPNPEKRDIETRKRIEAVADEVTENIRKKPLGCLKAEVFKIVLDRLHLCILGRDDERHFVDLSTFAIKKGFAEVGRRIRERGQFDSERDFYFLGMEELFEVFEGRANMSFIKTKIAARMRNFDRFDRKEVTPCAFIQRGLPLDLDMPADHDGQGVFRGTGISGGKVTGPARVVKTIKEINSIRPDDILVVSSTDPGWTTAFLVIKGIVLETGGKLAHGALLAREYGLPAVQLEGAMQLIPDGNLITVDGDSGVITLEDDAAI